MAIIQITANTETHEIIASIDGVLWGTVQDAHVYKFKDCCDGKDKVDISLGSPTLENNGVKVTNRTCVYASLKDNEKATAKQLDNGLADITVEEKDYGKAVASWLFK